MLSAAGRSRSWEIVRLELACYVALGSERARQGRNDFCAQLCDGNWAGTRWTVIRVAPSTWVKDAAVVAAVAFFTWHAAFQRD